MSCAGEVKAPTTGWNGLPCASPPKCMKPHQWPEPLEGECRRRKVTGEPDPRGPYVWHKSSQTWQHDPLGANTRRGLISAGTRDDGKISEGTRASEPSGARAAREKCGEDAREAAGLQRRRQSRGLGGFGSHLAVNLMLGRSAVDPATGDRISEGTILPHLEYIARTHPNTGPFTFDTPRPDLGANQTWIEKPEMVSARTAVAEKWFAHYGPLSALEDLPVTVHTTGLRTWLESDEFLLIDGECHREDDNSGDRWLKGDEYDIAVGRVQRSTGNLLEVLCHRYKPNGVLDDDDDDKILAALASRSDLPLCAWGHGPEWWWIDEAGRRKKDSDGKRVDDGSDGINLKECIVQVAPKMRFAASAVGEARGSMSQNLIVPEMGLRRVPYHEALPDVLTEGIGASAFGRVLERPHGQGGCM